MAAYARVHSCLLYTSCIELLEKWGYKVDCESRLPIADVIRAGKEGKLEEVFGTGTAAVSYTHLDVYKRQLYDGETLFDSGNVPLYNEDGAPALDESGKPKFGKKDVYKRQSQSCGSGWQRWLCWPPWWRA